jgi:hypothetical protein
MQNKRIPPDNKAFSKEDLERYVARRNNDSSNAECPITSDVIKVRARVTPCWHLFEENEIKKWCERRKECPCCRETIHNIVLESELVTIDLQDPSSPKNDNSLNVKRDYCSMGRLRSFFRFWQNVSEESEQKQSLNPLVKSRSCCWRS